MFRAIGLIIRAVRGIHRSTISTAPTLTYNRGIERYGKDFFDENYQFQFYKQPLQTMPDDIGWYHSQIGHITLMKKQSTTFFEIYETNVISEKEMAMNVRLCYADFVQTGIASKKNSVVTQNHLFVLFINDKMAQLEVRSDIESDITEKMIKKDFGEYLLKYLLKTKKEADEKALPIS